MKEYNLFIIIGCLFHSIVFSCNKNEVDEIEKVDEIDQFIGTYIGIEVNEYWDSLQFVRDTSDLTITLSKTSQDTVKVNWSTTGGNDLFTYENEEFEFVGPPYYSPSLRISNDSLFSYYKPGQGPSWFFRIAIKE